MICMQTPCKRFINSSSVAPLCWRGSLLSRWVYLRNVSFGTLRNALIRHSPYKSLEQKIYNDKGANKKKRPQPCSAVSDHLTTVIAEEVPLIFSSKSVFSHSQTGGTLGFRMMVWRKSVCKALGLNGRSLNDSKSANSADAEPFNAL